MQITALRPEDLPFSRLETAECEAARSADVTMEIPGIPGQFEVKFIGTGVATMPATTQEVFDVNHDRSSVALEWYQNKFVGRHWLLGDFKVTLAQDRASTGIIQAVPGDGVGPNTININEFFFDFEFRRFPFLNMTNVTPIRNEAVISAVPPVGSVFRLTAAPNESYQFTTGPSRVVNRNSAPSRSIRFNRCDVVVFPERNVGLTLLEQTRIDKDSYRVAVELENLTDTAATFAYFSVIHYAAVTTDDDYGFVLLEPRAKATVSYHVTSTVPERTIDLPFFAALYEPSRLNGSKSLKLFFEY